MKRVRLDYILGYTLANSVLVFAIWLTSLTGETFTTGNAFSLFYLCFPILFVFQGMALKLTSLSYKGPGLSHLIVAVGTFYACYQTFSFWSILNISFFYTLGLGLGWLLLKAQQSQRHYEEQYSLKYYHVEPQHALQSETPIDSAVAMVTQAESVVNRVVQNGAPEATCPPKKSNIIYLPNAHRR